jgi:hypothetical protein
MMSPTGWQERSRDARRIAAVPGPSSGHARPQVLGEVEVEEMGTAMGTATTRRHHPRNQRPFRNPDPARTRRRADRPVRIRRRGTEERRGNFLLPRRSHQPSNGPASRLVVIVRPTSREPIVSLITARYGMPAPSSAGTLRTPRRVAQESSGPGGRLAARAGVGAARLLPLDPGYRGAAPRWGDSDRTPGTEGCRRRGRRSPRAHAPVRAAELRSAGTRHSERPAGEQGSRRSRATVVPRIAITASAGTSVEL